MTKTRSAALCILLLSTLSCAQKQAVPEQGPVSVSFAVNASSKTYVSGDGTQVGWDKSDKILLWAENSSSGQRVLDGQEFSIYGISGSSAVFTSTLKSPMPKGDYVYYGINPAPVSITGYLAKYEVPSLQDGRGGGIMVARPAYGRELSPWESGEHVDMSMAQKLHLLKFYFHKNDAEMLEGEPLERIEVKFTNPVTGTVDVDILEADKDLRLVADEGNTVRIDLTGKNLEASTDGRRNYAFSTIIPCEFGNSDKMECTLYSNTHVVQTRPLSLAGRKMQAGHATPVRLTPVSVSPRCKLFITVDSNHIGEELQTVRLTAPSGCKFGDNGTNVITITPEKVGESYMLEYLDENAFRSLSGQKIDITMDTPHVTMNTSFTVENLSGKVATDIHFSTGWLLYEDFSGVNTFNSYDEYKEGFNTGDKDPKSFLNGWTGGRIGASAGKCIRIACRRETSANYSARVDSAPLNGILKSGAKLKVEFDYGDNNQYGGIYITPPDVGLNCFVGYTTNTKGYSSGSTSGIFAGDAKFYTHNKDGDYGRTPNHAEFVIADAGEKSIVRVAIRTEPEHLAGANNTTIWLYIDNVKVTVTE